MGPALDYQTTNYNHFHNIKLQIYYQKIGVLLEGVVHKLASIKLTDPPTTIPGVGIKITVEGTPFIKSKCLNHTFPE